MRKMQIRSVFGAALAVALFTVFLSGVSIASGVEAQKDELTGMLENAPAGMSQNIPVCSSSFAESLNKSNTVMWVEDPRYPGLGVPCCMDGLVCQPYPNYTQYVVAMPSLQSEYNCEKIAEDCGYTPICHILVGEALDPTTVCTSCVPYRHTFWATVYQNNNAPAPPPPPRPSDPCQGKICPGNLRCFAGRCIQIR